MIFAIEVAKLKPSYRYHERRQRHGLKFARANYPYTYTIFKETPRARLAQFKPGATMAKLEASTRNALPAAEISHR